MKMMSGYGKQTIFKQKKKMNVISDFYALLSMLLKTEERNLKVFSSNMFIMHENVHAHVYTHTKWAKGSFKKKLVFKKKRLKST